MGRGLTRLSADGPAIAVEDDILRAHIDHGLDADAHPRAELRPRATAPEVGHTRLLVHVLPDTVTFQFADDMVATSFTVVLDSSADIADALPCYSLLDADVEGLLRGAKESQSLGSYLTYSKRVGGVPREACEFRAAVDGDNVSILEYDLRGRDPMYDVVIDRSTETPWEAIITEERGSRTVVTDELLSALIELQGRDPRSYDLSDLGERTTDQEVGRAHQFYFFVCL